MHCLGACWGQFLLHASKRLLGSRAPRSSKHVITSQQTNDGSMATCPWGRPAGGRQHPPTSSWQPASPPRCPPAAGRHRRLLCVTLRVALCLAKHAITPWSSHAQPAGDQPTSIQPHAPINLHTWCHQPSGMNSASPASTVNSCTASRAAASPGNRPRSGEPRSAGEWLADSWVTGCGCRCGMAAGGTSRTRLRPRTYTRVVDGCKARGQNNMSCWAHSGCTAGSTPANTAAYASACKTTQAHQPPQPRTTHSRFW